MKISVMCRYNHSLITHHQIISFRTFSATMSSLKNSSGVGCRGRGFHGVLLLKSLLSSWLPRLLFIWAIFALITFGVMLTHVSDHPSFLNRYSTSVAAQLGVCIALVLVAGTGGIYLSRQPTKRAQIDAVLTRLRSRRAFAPFVVTVCSLLLVTVWLFFLGNHLPTYAFLRFFMCFSIMVWGLALIWGSLTALPAWYWGVLPWIILVVLAIFAVITINYYPALAKADEAFVFSMRRNALENGHVVPMIYRQVFPENYYGGVWTWMMAGWLRIAGLSFASGRLYVLFISLVSLIFMTLGSFRFYDKSTAFFTMLMGAFAFITSNHIRFDIHVALWLSIGIFFYSLARTSQRWWAHLLTGFTIGMTIDSNPVAYCFGLGLVLVYGWDYVILMRRERRWFWPPFWWMAFGGLIALGVFLTIHSGGTFLGEKTTSDVLKDYSVSIVEGLISGRFLNLAAQYFGILLTNQPILTGLMILGLLTTLRDRGRGDRFLFLMYFAWMGVIILAYFYFPAFYIVLGIPLFAILAGRGLARGIPWLLGTIADRASLLTQTTMILTAIWLFSALAYNIKTLPSLSLEDVVETGRQIAAITPKDISIVGAEPYYFGMIDHPNFIGGAVENFMLGSHKNMVPSEVWPIVSPEAIIFSTGWPSEPAQSPALLNYMTEQGFGMRACFENQSFGRVELWMRDLSQTHSIQPTCERVCNPRTGCSP